MVDRRHGFYSCRQFHAGVPVPVLELITLVESDPTLQPYPYQRLLDWLLAAHVVPARPAAWRSLSQSRCAEDAAAFVDDTLPRLLKRPPPTFTCSGRRRDWPDARSGGQASVGLHRQECPVARQGQQQYGTGHRLA